MNFQDMSVSVLGMGRSGLALTRELSSRGARVLISDSRPREELNPALEELGDCRSGRGGGHSDRVLQVDLVVLSPGVGAPSPGEGGLPKGLPVMGRWNRLATSGSPSSRSPGPTASPPVLIDRILGIVRSGGRSAILVGGGPGPSRRLRGGRSLRNSWRRCTPFDLGSPSDQPDRHLDRHADLEEYFAAKARLFARQGPQDVAVISSDDPQASRLADLLESHNLPGWLPGFPPPDRPACPEILRFSVRGPVLKGAWFVDGALWYRGKSEVSASSTGASRVSPRITWPTSGGGGRSALAGDSCRVSIPPWAHTAASSDGGGGTTGRVLFVNDSKSTNPPRCRQP